MRTKKLGVLLAITVLITALVGAQDAPPLSFFVEEGQIRSVIVVGSQAAAQDVASATTLAVFLGSQTYTETSVQVNPEICISEHEDVPTGTTIYDDPLTLKSLWYQDTLPWGDLDGDFDPWETHEEIRITPSDITELNNGALTPDGILEILGMEQTLGLPGVLYAADNVRIPPKTWVKSTKPVLGYNHSVDLDYFGTIIYPLPHPAVDPPAFMLLGELYHVIDAGFLRDYIVDRQMENPEYRIPIAYVLVGEPLYYWEQYIEVGEKREYKGKTLELVDVDVDHNKAYIRIYDANLGEIFAGLMALDPEHGFSPKLQEVGVTGGNAIAVGRSQHDVAVISETAYYWDNQGLFHFQYSWPIFAVDGISVFTGAAGKSYGLQCNVYLLDRFFLFKDRYCCVPFSDDPYPFSLQIYFSTTKNPETIYDNAYYEAWPPGYRDMEPEDYLGYDMYQLNACDFQFEAVLGLCETVHIPDCEEEFIFEGPRNYYLDTVEIPLEKPYFTIHFTDVITDGFFDFYIEQGKPGQTVATLQPVEVDPASVVHVDTDFDFDGWKATGECNLILIGGPVANLIVRQLVDDGVSWVDWTLSPGEWEYLPSPYGGYGILIVAGQDREATKEAAMNLINTVRALA